MCSHVWSNGPQQLVFLVFNFISFFFFFFSADPNMMLNSVKIAMSGNIHTQYITTTW